MDLKSIVPDRVSTPAKIYLFANILNGLGNGIMNVVFQLYLMSFGFDSAAIGSIVMMSAIGIALLTVPAGVLADRYGKKKIILLGFSITWLAIILVLTAKTLEMFRLAFLLLGLNNATGVVWGPLYSSFFDKEDMDRAFGLLGFISIISSSIGSLMGVIPPMLVDRYGFSFQYAYWVMIIIAIGFFAPSMPFYILSLRGLVEPKNKGGFRFNLRSKGVVAKFSLIRLIGTLGSGPFFSLFPYYVNTKFGVESDALGALFFASNFVQAGANILASRVSKRLGTLNTIAASIGLCAPFWLMFPLAPNFTWLSVVYIIRLSIVSISSPLQSSLYYKLLYEEEKATANSITTMVSQGSNIAAPWLGGQLMQQVSRDSPAYLGAALYPLYAASYYFLLRNEKEKRVSNRSRS